MKVVMCDVCEAREADKAFKVRVKKKGMWLERHYSPQTWGCWERLDVCTECGPKLFQEVRHDKKGNCRMDLV